ncbi:hypothetical protein [Microbispora corallina]|nr:hypothetical protein [Microbispora corallina]
MSAQCPRCGADQVKVFVEVPNQTVERVFRFSGPFCPRLCQGWPRNATERVEPYVSQETLNP